MARSRIAYDDIAAELREDILAGRLSVGDRLPTEAELCLRFGVGRSTVREALRMLSSHRWVTTTRGVNGGSAVARLEPATVSELLEDSIVMLTRGDRTSVDELLETREFLEVPAARLAAKRRSDADLAALRAAVAAETDALAAQERFVANRSFHELLLHAAGNAMLSVVTEPVFSVLQRRFLRDQAPADFGDRVHADHVKILRAVEKGDGERAEREMARHLRRLRATYERIDRAAQRPEQP